MKSGPGQRLSDDPRAQAALWAAFAGPQKDEEFYGAWLALLCSKLRDIHVGVLLLRSQDSSAFSPVALWPAAPRDLAFLGSIAERALAEGRGVMERASEAPTAPLHIAYPLGDREHLLGAVVVEASASPENEAQVLLRELHWGLGWLQELLARRETLRFERKLKQLGTVTEIISASLQQTPSRQSFLDIVNQITRYLACSRVLLGVVEHGTIKIEAVSDAAWFEANSMVAKHYVHAMEDAADQLSPIVYRKEPGDHPSDGNTTLAHAALANATDAQHIASIPLLLGDRCIAILTAERSEDKPFSEDELEWFDTLSSLLAPAIEQKRLAERGLLGRLRDDAKKLANRFFGTGHLVWKFIGAGVVLAIAALTLLQLDYRVTAKTVIEGETQRVAAAPFQGFIATSLVRAGDVVRAGQVLCTLDDRDLKLERDKWLSEREQHLRELREAMANHDLTQIQIISAQVQQSEAQLALANERVARAKVTAPIDGLVISGDLSQLVGSPVEQGKQLFELAPLTNYRVILQVDESEIRYLAVGQQGKLIVAGFTEPLQLQVTKLTPVATAQDGRNFFRVEADLKQSIANLRPGMEGIGKVSVGEHRLWWILTHSFTDWLRVWLWKWLP